MGTFTHPYAGVDWSAVDYHRSQFHLHVPRAPITADSPDHEPPPDADVGTDLTGEAVATRPGTLVRKYRSAGYSVLAVTEHGHKVEETVWPWSRWDVDPGALGMVPVEGAELDTSLSTPGSHQVVSLDADLTSDAFPDGTDEPTRSVLAEIEARDGLAFLAHPGKYFGADEYAEYVDLFEESDALVGVEILNAADRYPDSPAIWDGLLDALGPDRPVWALGNDDYHAKPRVEPRFDRSRTVLLLAEQSKPAVRRALREGRSYVQYDGDGDGAAPGIERIDVDADRISVRAPDARRIEWVAGGERVHDGTTLAADRVAGETYVRAELLGADGAVTYTQPFFPA